MVQLHGRIENGQWVLNAGGVCQHALWRLEHAYTKGSRSYPFKNVNDARVIDEMQSYFTDAERSIVNDTNQLYYQATNIGQIPFVNPETVVKDGISVTMETSGAVSTCEIQNFQGTIRGERLQYVTKIEITDKNKNKYIFENNSSIDKTNKLILYKDQDCKTRVNLNDITRNESTKKTIFYVKKANNVNNTIEIASIKIYIDVNPSGYKIEIKHFHNTNEANQDVIQCKLIEPGEKQTISITAENNISYPSLKIKKYDNDDGQNAGIQDLSIKIYFDGEDLSGNRKEGWVTFNSTGDRTLTSSKNNATIFRTDEKGWIELKNLKMKGNFYIYECRRNDTDDDPLTDNEKMYDIDVQREWKYKDSKEPDIGNDKKKNADTNTIYLGVESINDNQVHNILFPQKKGYNPNLIIKKYDNDEGQEAGIKDLSIKIYLKGKNSNGEEKEGWITFSDEGVRTLTSNVKNANVFRTNDKGLIELNDLKITGDFYIYEYKRNVDYEELSESEKIYNIETQRKWKYPDSKEPFTGNDKKTSENLIYLGKANVSNTKKEFKVNYAQTKDKKLTIRKIDYDDNSLIDNAKFKIFYRKTGIQEIGWLGYSENKITYEKSFNNAEAFETGKSYCGETAYPGEINLSGLEAGYYYIYEVGSGSEEYELADHPGYGAISGVFNRTGVPENMKPTGEFNLIAYNSCALGYTNVDFVDGSNYEFVTRYDEDKDSRRSSILCKII